MSILRDPNIAKVGVGASKDVKHLSQWWGIDSKEHTDCLFSFVQDLETDVLDDRVSFKSLQEMCATVLKQDLPKLKEKNAKRKKEQRKRGKRNKTSHWRRDDLTKEMKEYAANDVSCAIDIWNIVQHTDESSHEKDLGV